MARVVRRINYSSSSPVRSGHQTGPKRGDLIPPSSCLWENGTFILALERECLCEAGTGDKGLGYLPKIADLFLKGSSTKAKSWRRHVSPRAHVDG